MIIADYGFLLVFLPLTVIVYWRLSGRNRLRFLCIASYGFYALGDWRFVPLLLGLSLLTYSLARQGRVRAGVIINLLALGLFKYWNFGVENINLLAGAALPLLGLALPLGISFYVFKSIGYLLDVGAGRYESTRDPLLFVTYVAFFPQISAGPISRFDDTAPQLIAPPERLGKDMLYRGLAYISFGLAKKVFIADVLAEALAAGLFDGVPVDGVIPAWTAVAMFGVQLYFDFSAYTDIVLGVGLLLGVRLPENFDNPYLATSPRQFWDRWHMSLTGWFRSYLFFPLSRRLLRRWGGRRSAQAQYVANLITMGLIGLWHGAGWGFVLWGIYHGLLLNVFAWANRRRLRLEGHIPLLVLVLIGWALFLSPDLGFAVDLLGQMVGAGGLGRIAGALYEPLPLTALALAGVMIVSGRVEAANLKPARQDAAFVSVLGILVVVALLHLGEAATFIYVQF